MAPYPADHPFAIIDKVIDQFDGYFWRFGETAFFGEGSMRVHFSSLNEEFIGTLYVWDELNLLDIWIMPMGPGGEIGDYYYRFEHDFRSDAGSGGGGGLSLGGKRSSSSDNWETTVKKLSKYLKSDERWDDGTAAALIQQAADLEPTSDDEAKGLKRLWRSIVSAFRRNRDEGEEGFHIPMPEPGSPEYENWPDGRTTSGPRIPSMPIPKM